MKPIEVVYSVDKQGWQGGRLGEPVTVGLPLPRGVLTEPFQLVVVEGGERPQPIQARVLDRWSDSSVRWVLVDWLADSSHGGAKVMLASPDMDLESPKGGIRVDESHPGRLLVDNGVLRLVFSRTMDSLFEWESPTGKAVAVGSEPRLRIVARGGKQVKAVLRSTELAEMGATRVTVRTDWTLQLPDGTDFGEMGVRVHVFAGSPTICLDLSITNPKEAAHPGGLWSLGSEGSIFLEEFAVEVPVSDFEESGEFRVSAELGEPALLGAWPLELYQDSSGGPNWNSRNHQNRYGKVPLAFSGYRLRQGGTEERSGTRATPIVTVRDTERFVGVAMQHFWQNFPKALELRQETIDCGLFPRQYGDVHEIQGGERKTHRIHIAYGEDGVTELPLDWCRSPLMVHARPEWYASCETAVALVVASEDPNDHYKDLVQAAIEGPSSFFEKREIADEYGWRHFGELYADHESAFHQGSEIFLSHYNNQYDAIAGFARQFFRTGRTEWLQLMNELSGHVVDIDLYHTDLDKSAYNHGQFWHTIHYVDAGASTHRAYPPAEGVNGGGPSTGNLYTHGLLLHYFMTGNPLSREAVGSLGQYVIDADDGSKTIFRFLDPGGFTGHVSESGFDQYHGPGRSPANAISALLDAHRLTSRQELLIKAEQLIQRCVHPDDDLEARNLADAENRWFHTMFLLSLVDYLDRKTELGELDAMYSYARASLLHYTDWTVREDVPYLSKPEILQFPTETWAAQDLRKCEVLNRASVHAAPEIASEMRRRARFFFDHALAELGAMPTRGYCRPLVLLLSNGYSQAYFDLDLAEPAAPAATSGFRPPRPVRFETQKTRAMGRAKLLGASGAGALLLLAVAAFVLL